MSLLRLLLRRLLGGALVCLIVATATFVLFFLAKPPIQVARLLAGKQATQLQIMEIARTHGLLDPPWVQYKNYMWGLLHGNLGYSYYNQEPVRTIIHQALPATVSLMVGGFILWMVTGLGVGIYSAVHPRSLVDRAATGFVLFGWTAPEFVIGQLLIVAIFVPLSLHGFAWITTGYNPLSQGFGPWLGAMILPWITLAISSAAVYTRLSRGSLLDTFGEDYIRTAHAKGLSERRVLYTHAARAALTPVVSQVGIDIGALISGDVIVETVFGLQGVGQQSVEAISAGDTPVVLGTVLVATVFVVAANLVVDMLYGALDPRVRIH
jgi:peptide/nickel transport system permease protein